MGRTRGVVGGDLAGSREPAGGRFARVVTKRGVGVRGRSHGAEHRGGVKRRRRLLAIVGVPGRALHIVDRTTRGSSGRGRSEACHFGIRLGVHCGICNFPQNSQEDGFHKSRRGRR